MGERRWQDAPLDVHVYRSTDLESLTPDQWDYVRPRDADPGTAPLFTSDGRVGHFQNLEVRLDPDIVMFGGGEEGRLHPHQGADQGRDGRVRGHLNTSEPVLPRGEHVYLSCRSPLSYEGFAVEDAAMWGPDGRILVVARQTRLAGS